MLWPCAVDTCCTHACLPLYRLQGLSALMSLQGVCARRLCKESRNAELCSSHCCPCRKTNPWMAAARRITIYDLDKGSSVQLEQLSSSRSRSGDPSQIVATSGRCEPRQTVEWRSNGLHVTQLTPCVSPFTWLGQAAERRIVPRKSKLGSTSHLPPGCRQEQPASISNTRAYCRCSCAKRTARRGGTDVCRGCKSMAWDTASWTCSASSWLQHGLCVITARCSCVARTTLPLAGSRYAHA